MQAFVFGQQLDDSITIKLRTGIEGFKERYHSPSIAVAIVHDQNIIFDYASGYIDIKNKIPATIDSRYSIQSVTKLFTATMYMQLVQKEQIRLNDKVKNYLPELAQSSANEITLLELATHTAGLPRNSAADIHFAEQVNKWIIGGKRFEQLTPAAREELLQSLRTVRYFLLALT